MSGTMEQLIAALTRNAEATERNNELLEAAAEGREKVLAAAEAASTKAATSKATANKATAAKSDDKPAAEKPAAKTDADDADVPSVDDVNNAIKKYVGGTDRKEERTARSAKVKGVLTKFSPEGTETVNGGTLLADKRAAFIKTVDAWIKAGDLTEPPAADDDDGLLDD